MSQWLKCWKCGGNGKTTYTPFAGMMTDFRWWFVRHLHLKYPSYKNPYEPPGFYWKCNVCEGEGGYYYPDTRVRRTLFIKKYVNRLMNLVSRFVRKH